ncbi:MAG: thiopurine S-methyltransferase [Gammaproteobacteria bacterium]
MDTEFWHERWLAGQIGFHQQEINPYLIRYWPALGLPEGTRILAPLCGKSRDMTWLLEQGCHVVGVEVSRLAVEAFFSENNLTPTLRQEDGCVRYTSTGIELLCGDFFTLTRDHIGRIEGVYDRASLIALPPALRPRYAAHLAALLDTGINCLLITLDYNQLEMAGPPFAVSANEVARLFGRHFTIESFCSHDVLETHQRFREAGLSQLSEHTYLLERT